MESPDKQPIARLVKAGRAAKGYTQQELADLTRISLRSVQRIENGEVLPRQYTLRLLEEHLGIHIGTTAVEMPVEEKAVDGSTSDDRAEKPRGGSRARKWILTVSMGLLFLLLTGAYLAQSARFPETDFERLLLWSGVVVVYTGVLLKIWK
jgi:transcriptional regulator with XRE-family HTH domain